MSTSCGYIMRAVHIHAVQDVPIPRIAVSHVGPGAEPWIAEGRPGDEERDLMPGEVGIRFAGVPFDLARVHGRDGTDRASPATHQRLHRPSIEGDETRTGRHAGQRGRTLAVDVSAPMAGEGSAA